MPSVRRFGLILVTAAFMSSNFLGSAALAASAPTTPAPSAKASEFEDGSGKTNPDGTRPDRPAVVKGVLPKAQVKATATGQLPECPPSLMAKCQFVPAAYQQNDPTNPRSYGNYDTANRPADGIKINTIVIHDTEGSLASALATFQDPTSYASANYVIDTDGTVYQTVLNKDIAWHAGNWYANMHAIGIEHVGVAAQGNTSYTDAMYRSSAQLTRWLASQYGIPLDRQHIVGHDNVPGPTPAYTAGMHWDPGPFWNWQHYMALLGAPVVSTAGPTSELVTISPRWKSNQPPVTECANGTCTTLPTQSANFVYLHTSASDDAPLLSDPAIHPDGGAGTTQIEDWSATADYGQQFAVAGRQGDWTGIWYGGQVGWFKNAPGACTALPTTGKLITPRSGLASIPMYGRAYPEASAYPATIPAQSVVPLQYSIPAGQSYATTGSVPADYYYAKTIDSSLPGDHTLVVGQDSYLEIQFNHRVAYVKQSDVAESLAQR
jgi:N-acetyl-anhydromuramyl-L-alanine amidase AmpD